MKSMRLVKEVALWFSPDDRSSNAKGLKPQKLGCETLEKRELLSASPYNVPYKTEVVPVAEYSTVDFSEVATNAIDLSALSTGASKTEEVLTVTSTLDDGGEGTLRVVLDKADDGARIVFSDQLKSNTISLSGLEITVDKSVTIDASNTPGIVIDAENASGAFRFVGGDAELIGISIVNGESEDSGAGVYAESNLKLTNATISDCFSDGNGGGVFCLGDLTLKNVSVDSCSATGSGGGILCMGDLTLENVSVDSCSATGSGGGIFCLRDATTTTEESNVSITDCSAGEDGGGIYCRGDMTLKNVVVSVDSCSATGSGGGIYCLGDVTNATEKSEVFINGCSAGESGGGIYCENALTLVDSRIENNAIKRSGKIEGDGGFESYGGGIYCASLDATNVVVANNSITCDVKGTDDEFGKIDERHVVGGGGVYSLGAATLTDCNVLKNTVVLTSDRHADVEGGGVAGAYVKITGGEVSENVASAIGNFVGGSYEATVRGGGVYGSASVEMEGVDVLNNTAKSNRDACNAYALGGGVASDGSVTIKARDILDATDKKVDQKESKIQGNSVNSSAKYVSKTFGGGVYAATKAEISDADVEANTASYSSTRYGSFEMAIDEEYVGAWGGGIFVGNAQRSALLRAYGTAILQNVDVVRNVATNGGGISGKVLNITNGSIKDNRATSNGGGVYMNSGTLTASGTPADKENNKEAVWIEFSGNVAGADGGAIYAEDANATLQYCKIVDNAATSDGGGVYMNSGTLTASGTPADKENNKEAVWIVFSGNVAGADGGAIYAEDANATLRYCRIVDNAATSDGGAISVTDGQTNLSYCVVSDNEAKSNGGAVYNNGNFTATNSQFDGNSALNGGAVYTTGSFVLSKLTNCTVVANSATQNGGGVFVDPTDETRTFLYNTILVSNVAGKKKLASDAYQSTNGGLYAFNCVSAYNAWTRGRYNVVYNASTPLFVNVATKDYRLAVNSQAIDKGNNAASNDSRDLDGEKRIVNGCVDVGAYEYQLQTAVEAPSDVRHAKTVNEKTCSYSVAWVDNSSDEDGFVVEYFNKNDGVLKSERVDANVTKWSTSNLDPNATYVFTVYAYKGADKSTGVVSSRYDSGVWTVESAEDDGGATTLRVILAKANYGDTITFDPSLANSTILLAGLELNVRTNVTISGYDGTDEDAKPLGIQIDAINSSRAFNISSDATLKGLEIVNGQTIVSGKHSVYEALGGGVYCSANLTLEDVDVRSSVAQYGGGIFCNGNLTATDGGISQNDAVSYFIATNGDSENYNAFGGGVYSRGKLTLNDCDVFGNTCVATNDDGDGVYANALGGGAYSETEIVVNGGSVVDNKAESINPSDKAASLGGGLCVGVYSNWNSDSSAELHAKALNGTITISESNQNTSGSKGATISGNVASSNSSYNEVYGGGVYAETVVCKKATLVSNNSAIGTTYAFGGGVFAYQDLTVEDSTITKNKVGGTSDAFGGGFAVGCNLVSLKDVSSSSPTLEITANVVATLVSDNETTGAGGGIYLASTEGGVKSVTAKATDVDVDGNKAAMGGGGVLADVGSKLRVTRGTLRGNTATSGNGGAIYNSGNDVSFKDSAIYGNKASNGGAIYNDGTAALADSEVYENSASENGGAIYNVGNATFDRDQLYKNEASFGGAVYNASTLYAYCSLIDRNKATDGGALYNAGIEAVAKLTDCTVATNEASKNGGGIYASAGDSNQVRLNNTIVATNVSKAKKPTHDVYQTSGKGTVYAYSCISSYNAWYRKQNNKLYDGTKELFADSSARDYRLTEKSQALNVGNNYLAIYANRTNLKFDLAQNARIYDDKVDVGAYERQDKDVRFLNNVTITSDGLNPGATLKANVTLKDASVKFEDANVRYQWFRIGANNVPALIEGETGSSYVTTEEDCGCVIKVVVKGIGDYAGTVSQQITVQSDGTLKPEEVRETVSLGNTILPTTFAPTAVYAAITVDGVTTTFGAEGVTPEELGLGIGTYDTLLEYADATGETVATYTLVLTVDNAASLEVVEKSSFGGRVAKFDFNLTKDDGRAVSIWEIAWGDGTTTRSEYLSTSWTVAHYYAKDGAFDVSLTAVYNDGSSETFEAFATRTVGTISKTTGVLDRVFAEVGENGFEELMPVTLDEEFKDFDF